jgi:hypothetical protein
MADKKALALLPLSQPPLLPLSQQPQQQPPARVLAVDAHVTTCALVPTTRSVNIPPGPRPPAPAFTFVAPLTDLTEAPHNWLKPGVLPSTLTPGHTQEPPADNLRGAADMVDSWSFGEVDVVSRARC